MQIEKIIKKLHPLERKVVPYLAKHKSFKALVKASGLKEVEVMRALQWLENKNALKLEETKSKIIELAENGKIYLKKGLPEKRLLNELKHKPSPLSRLRLKSGLDNQELNVSIGTLKKKVAIITSKEKELIIKITDAGKKLLDRESLEELLLKKIKDGISLDTLKAEEMFAFENLKKRKDIIKIIDMKEIGFELTELGKKLTKSKMHAGKYVDALTPKMLKSGEWKKKEFRAYDVSINVPHIYGGRRHFVNEAINNIKKIWLEMGFKEMEGPLVQTSFWDLDSLFVPQDHPARSMQDTFFIKDPKYGKLPKELAQRVKATHEDGWKTGSKGWQYKWDEKKAKENLLRTHTTVLSAQTIAKLKKSDLPAKFFSVNKVFRNETLDWKHLFEFHQVEGIVVGYDLTLKNLFGYIKEFYSKMGFKDVRLVPSHFPYTEPSMEVIALHPSRNEWIEFGGTGIFRPEVVKPLFGEDITVLAWGNGMERIITEYYDINDLRELYKNDLKQMREMKSWVK